MRTKTTSTDFKPYADRIKRRAIETTYQFKGFKVTRKEQNKIVIQLYKTMLADFEATH
jgi:hypothetical protein